MNNAVRKPGQNVKDGVLVGREDVGEVGAVQHILKSWQDTNPNMGSVIVRNKATGKCQQSRFEIDGD